MSNYKDMMLISPDEIKAQSDLNYNVTDTVIGASIRVAQNIYLKDIIGKDLLNRLQELAYNAMNEVEDNIDDEDNIAYKTLVDEYIDKVLTYKVASEICARISLKIRNMGVVKNSDTNVNDATLDEIIYMKQTYDTYFNEAVNDMVEFICENKDAFPEADFICGCGKHPKYASTGLWLG